VERIFGAGGVWGFGSLVSDRDDPDFAVATLKSKDRQARPMSP
jgi:hypothetical protein